MDNRGLFLVFGSLALIIAVIVAGAMLLPGPVGGGLLALGIMSGIVWLIAAFYIASAMNSDI
jgi:hypothetical protein